MAFIFSTSHLPETRVRRPDHLEEEDEEEYTLRPPPRAGGVRAFSHLPEPRPLEDRSGPLSTRPATPVGRPRPYVDPDADEDRDADHATEPDSDHDDDEAPRAHDEYEDDAPWHMPRLTAQELPPQSHDEDAPGPRSARDAGFGDAPPAGRSATRYPDTGSYRRPQDIHDDFHSPSAPDSSASLYEKHLPPGFHQHSGQLQGLADWAAYHDLVRRAGGGTEDAHDQHGGFFQNMADTRGTRQAQTSSPSRPPSGAPQTFAQSVRPAAQPQAQAQAQRPAANPAQNAPAASKPPAPAPPKLKRYFVFPRGANVVILYNKKAVGNLKLQHSSGTTMEQQALGMIQDYSGATTDPRLIDISDPGWVAKLDALAAKNKGGFTHLVILDHGYAGNQRFGRFPGSYNNETSLTPQSTAWKIVSSVMAPDGHIHLGGCRVGQDQEGQNYLNELLKSLGKGSKITIDAVTGPMLNLNNAFEGDLIQAQPVP